MAPPSVAEDYFSCPQLEHNGTHYTDINQTSDLALAIESIPAYITKCLGRPSGFSVSVQQLPSTHCFRSMVLVEAFHEACSVDILAN